MYRIFNKSSENMSEIHDKSIDLIIADPPYNVGTIYGKSVDLCSQELYLQMLLGVIKEMNRVLTDEGIIIFHAPHCTRLNGKDFDFSWQITRLFDSSFKLATKHEIIIEEESHGNLPSHCIKICDWNKDRSKIHNYHSSEHHALVFVKNCGAEFKLDFLGKFVYKQSNGHPCPSNLEYLEKILDRYFLSNMRVLDPFMGTARLGEKVLKRGGHFFGYEIEKSYFIIAKERLRRIANEI